ncbi:MAG: hypothetical protein HZA90_13485 [Verrucomicrobia bacterium]|nr:hypothetical protein [Verrucomicrobiota bacterium]
MKTHARNPIRTTPESAHRLLATLLVAGILTASTGHATLQYEQLKAFGDSNLAGYDPTGLIEGSDGALYGTTASSFDDLWGVVFRVEKDGSGYRVLHYFGGNKDGSYPWRLIQGNDGALYGTTIYGGTNGAGTLFKLDKDGTGYVILRHFSEGASGGGPEALFQASDGALYGNGGGGAYTNEHGLARGTLFKLNKNGDGYTLLHHFGSVPDDGDEPSGPLVEGADGTLYGTTQRGGGYTNQSGQTLGTVFALHPDGSGYRVLHQFRGGPDDGSVPARLLVGRDGALYGTTHSGGAHTNQWGYEAGTVFTLNPDGSGYRILHHFAGTAGGGGHTGTLVEGADGALYGATTTSGSTDYATLFRLNRDGTGFQIQSNGNWTTGESSGPLLPLIRGNDGVFFGVAPMGGTNRHWYLGNPVGALFRFDPDGAGYTTMLHFQSYFGTEGNGPNRVLAASDGKLYGTTHFGGANLGLYHLGLGTVFSLNRDGSEFSLLHSFGGVTNDAQYPRAGLIEGRDGFLYGTTGEGGTHGAGTVFTLGKEGSGYRLLHHFAGAPTDGAEPGGLTEGSDGALYGTTRLGGVYSNAFGDTFGTVFKLNKDGNGYRVLHHFLGHPHDGAAPGGLLEGLDGRLYGMTSGAGSNWGGTVFRLNRDGSDYAVLHHFDGASQNGERPYGLLLEGSDGALYGTTDGGGAHTNQHGQVGGTVFKLNKDGQGYRVLHRFGSVANEGLHPFPGLLRGPDGRLYGATSSVVGDRIGTVFRLREDGSGYEIPHFGLAGQRGELVVGGDGAFYGTGFGEEVIGYHGILFKLSWPVVITQFQRNGDASSMTWSGIPNWPYRIQTRTDLMAPQDSWVDIGTNTTSLDGTFQLSIPEPPDSTARFYRIAWP